MKLRGSIWAEQQMKAKNLKNLLKGKKKVGKEMLKGLGFDMLFRHQ